MDWQSMVARLLGKKGPPSEGGWSAFGTSWSQIDILDPLMTPWLTATCEKARAGWPCDSVLEKMRDVFALATTLEDRKAAANQIQTYAMQVVTHVPLGEWYGVSAARDTVVFPDSKVRAPVTVFWGIRKK
jgi:peptide/nickel transport system substrate-binding protein